MRCRTHFSWTLLLTCVAWFLPTAAPASTDAARPRVGVLTDNYPFSFRSADGQIEGFAYDLTREIERVMGLRFERIEGPTQEINAAFREGRIDVLQSYADFPERAPHARFSVPYMTMSGAILVRSGQRGIRTLEDLRGRRVAVHQGSLGETVLRRAGLDASIVSALSVEDCLRQVADGRADATLVGRLSGLALAYHLGLKNLRTLPQDVPGYEVRYCLAVSRDANDLLAHLNEGLAILVRTGRYNELYRRWFAHVEPVRYSARQVGLAIMAGLVLALAVSLWAVVRLRRLQRRILRQQEELRASVEKHRAIFEGAYEGLLLLERTPEHADFTVRQVNITALKLLARASRPAPGTALRELLGADAALVDEVERGLVRSHVVGFEYHRAGKAQWWRVQAGPIGNHTLLSLGDITESVHARQQRHEQEQRLMQSQKLEAIGTLAGGVAHDFNNILTAIYGNAELMLMTMPKDSPDVESVEQILKAAGRARQLVRQILLFSRRQETTRQPLAVAPVIQETLDLLRSAARGSVTLEFRPGEGIPLVMADPSQLHQVVMNIGMNAVHAMRGRPGRLTLSEEAVEFTAADVPPDAGLRPGRYVRIAIQDTGPGIPPDVLPRIFEPFFSTKPPSEGTGLGLSVVHGIMHQHGGAVTVYSHLGRGTRFDLYFPVAADQSPTATDLVPVTQRGHGEAILVIDDDGENIRTLRKVLIHLGYQVTAFERPREAVADFAVHGGRYAAVLCDQAMPDMNGLQVAAHIRTLDPTKPLILASGFFTEAEENEAIRLRVTRCVHKPLTVPILQDVLASCVGPKATNAEAR